MYTLIETAKLTGIDPQAWLADVLARGPNLMPAEGSRLDADRGSRFRAD